MLLAPRAESLWLFQGFRIPVSDFVGGHNAFDVSFVVMPSKREGRNIKKETYANPVKTLNGI
jgi:hypothetical protein